MKIKKLEFINMPIMTYKIAFIILPVFIKSLFIKIMSKTFSKKAQIRWIFKNKLRVLLDTKKNKDTKIITSGIIMLLLIE
jgi:hypothetical protein